VEATSTAYAQSKLMVANKGFMSEQEKDNQVAVTTLFTLVFVLYSKEGTVFLFDSYSSSMGLVHFLATCSETKGLFPR
jgi:hypothetical protein